ncbi:MAG: hypothetical protein ACI4S2_17740 [Lachnospiraceae bacterium]
MDYYFIFGERIFAVHSTFEIEWYEWHKKFLHDTIENIVLPITHYYIESYDIQPDVENLRSLYHGKNQHVYQGEEGEIRVHYLLGEEISIYCEERHDGYYIFINPVLTQEAYMYFVAMMLEKVLLESNALIFHSAYTVYGNEAILFTGPSGIGKSTQADLWVKYRDSKIINGDRSVLQKKNNIWNACGFPICGTSKISEDEDYPIRAIVYLKQGKENKLQRLKGLNAFRSVLGEISVNYWNSSASGKAIGLVENLCTEIPVYLLECTPTVEAVECLFEEIK